MSIWPFFFEKLFRVRWTAQTAHVSGNFWQMPSVAAAGSENLPGLMDVKQTADVSKSGSERWWSTHGSPSQCWHLRKLKSKTIKIYHQRHPGPPDWPERAQYRQPVTVWKRCVCFVSQLTSGWSQSRLSAARGSSRSAPTSERGAPHLHSSCLKTQQVDEIWGAFSAVLVWKSRPDPTRLTVTGEDGVAVGHRVLGRHRAATSWFLRCLELKVKKKLFYFTRRTGPPLCNPLWIHLFTTQWFSSKLAKVPTKFQ